MVTLITIIHIFVCFFLILVVLLQAGKGGGMGVAFGSSTSAQVFGGRGAGSFLEKLTAGTAIVFMLTSMTLAYFASQSDNARLQKISAQKQTTDAKAKEKAADAKAQKEAADRAKALSSTPAAPAPSTAPAPATVPPASPPPGAGATPNATPEAAKAAK